MKRIVLLSICLLTIPSLVVAAQNACSGRNAAQGEAMEKARAAYQKAGDDFIEDIMKPAEEGFWDKCVGNVLNGGFSFDLALPSIDGLLDKACNYAKSYVNSEVSQIKDSVSYDFGYGVEAGASAGAQQGGGTTPKVKVKDTSSTLANDIWKALK